MRIRDEIRFRAKTILTSLSRDIHSDREKNNIAQSMCKTGVNNGFTIKIKLFRYKRFKDGRCAYKNTESSHLKRDLHFEQVSLFFAVDLNYTLAIVYVTKQICKRFFCEQSEAPFKHI